MGFISAVKELGELETRKTEGSGSDELDDFLQLPLPDIEDETRRGKIIRVWLSVNGSDAPIEILGVSKIDLVDYMAGGGDIQEQKQRYLYREPTGSNVSWGFSPIYKLGKAPSDGASQLVGTKDGWASDSTSRFYKLEKRVLADYEKMGYFKEGSTDRIMEDLTEKAERISELWSDKKRSYLLVFGIEDGDRFLHPGEAPIFRKYFKKKLDQSLGSGGEGICGLCGHRGDSVANMDEIFKFATFDKVNFLPGISGKQGGKEKVFPLCSACLASLARGREALDGLFLDGRTIPGVRLYIVPEILLGQDRLAMASEQTRDFLSKGIGMEKHVFRKLAKQDNSLIFHFVFWEKNQAQERIHLMIEDVPPSRLKRLEVLWRNSYLLFLWNPGKNPVPAEEALVLDRALQTIYYTLNSLAGKNDQDKTVMRERTLGILGKLLCEEHIDIREVKQLMVSRFAGLFADPEWISKRGRSELQRMMAVIDFLTRANGR